jgi:hypothetical protein
MVVHLVCFKYKQDTEEAARATHRERLRGLAGLDGVVDLKVGEDFVGAERSYDTGLMVLLRDRAALESYRADPTHVPVAQYGVGLCTAIVSADFEA